MTDTSITMQELTEDANEITQEVAYLFTSDFDVTVEDYGHGRAKVSGRGAHYVRDRLDDTPIRLEREINQHAFTVEWDA